MSPRSTSSFQKRAYSWTQWATSRSGSPCKEMNTSRPFFSRAIRPARSSSLRCLVTALSAVSNGSAISRNRAGPRDSRPMIARRVGCEMAVRTSLSGSMPR